MSEPVTPFELSQGERSHPLWTRLKRQFEDMLAARRKKNDGPLNQFDTAALRGEIKILRALIDLEKEPLPLLRE